MYRFFIKHAFYLIALIAMFANSAAFAAIDGNLVAYWGCDEGSGNTLNDSAGGHTGMLSAGIAFVDDTPSNSGTALDFTAGGDPLITVEDAPDLNNWDPGFTVAMWICPRGGGSLMDKSESDAPLGDKIGERCYEDPATLGANFRYTAMLADEGATLEAGDVVTVSRGALYDQRRNPNKLTRYTVRAHADNADHGDFTVQRAAVGKPRHTRQATLLIQNNTCGAGGDAACEGSRRVSITARSTSAAAGAAGNGWIVYPYIDPERTEPADSEIDVGVDPVHRIISYTIAEGKITLANLSAALNADAEFKRYFSSRVVTSSATNGVLGIADPSGGTLVGGFSVVGLRVRFTDHVRSVPEVAETDTAPGARYELFFGSGRAPPEGFRAPLTFASLFLGDSTADNDGVAVRCQRRGSVVYLEYAVTDGALLPRAGTPVSVPDGVAAGHGDQNEDGTPDVQNLRQRRFHLRSDPTIPSQFGYAREALRPQGDNSVADAAGAACNGASS